MVESSSRTRVSVWSRTGRFMTSFADRGRSDGQLSMPGQIAIDAGGSVYVADAGNHRIEKFSRRPLRGLDRARRGTVRLAGQALDAARGRDRAGREHLRDELYRRVQHYAADGRFLGSFGQLGSGPGQFQAPQGVAVAGDGSVYVADGRCRRCSGSRRAEATSRRWPTPDPATARSAIPRTSLWTARDRSMSPTSTTTECSGFGDRGAALVRQRSRGDPSERLALRVTGRCTQHFADAQSC